jgi:pimeloyl-ACP methyl ester carboxylesterase
MLALCGPQQFVRFGEGFRGVREMLVLHIPGFVGDERLPAGVDVALAYQMSAIDAAIGPDAPLILVGYSSGGTFAYSLASQLEARGRQVSAVVLLDTYPPRPDGVAGRPEAAVVQHLLSNPEWRHYLSETRLTAMGWYMGVVAALELRPVMAPTLLVRARQPMAGLGGEDWRAGWPFPHETSDVPGDHYSILEVHGRSAAHAVESWLRVRLGGSARSLVLD